MRMTLDTAGQYRGVGHCLRALVAAEGPRALLRGLGPSLAAIFPEAAITYGARARGAPRRLAMRRIAPSMLAHGCLDRGSQGTAAPGRARRGRAPARKRWPGAGAASDGPKTRNASTGPNSDFENFRKPQGCTTC